MLCGGVIEELLYNMLYDRFLLKNTLRTKVVNVITRLEKCRREPGRSLFLEAT